MLFPSSLATPLLDTIVEQEGTPIISDEARLAELWRLDAANTTPFGVAPTVQWDVWDTSCDFDRDDKLPVGSPIVRHIAGTAHALQPCTAGWPIPEQGDAGKRLGLEQALTAGLEVATDAANDCPPDQLNIASHTYRLAGAAADEPFMPGVILTPWLSDVTAIVGFVPQELVVGKLTRTPSFDAPTNTYAVLDEFRFVFSYTFGGQSTNTNTGITP